VNAAKQGGSVGRTHAALVYTGLRDFVAVGLAGIGLVLADILENSVDTPAGLYIGDTCAHHASAQQTHFLRAVAGDIFGTRLAGLDRVHVEEKSVDHGLCHRRDGQPGQVPAFDAQRGVVVHLRAFDHRRQSRLRGGVKAARLLFEDRWRHAEHAGNFRVAGRAAWHFVVLVVPRVVSWGGCTIVGGYPGQRGGAQRRGIRHQLLHQTEFQRFTRVEQSAFHDVGLRTHQAQQSCHFCDAARARNQSERDFW